MGKQPLYPHIPKSRKMTLEAGLTAQQKRAGLYLVEPDPHTVELRDKTGERVAAWSSSGATIAEIRAEAEQYLKEPRAPKRQLERTEMLIYDDGRYRVTLKSNGMYIIDEYEPADGKWYAVATGDHKYMMEIAREYGLDRLLIIL